MLCLKFLKPKYDALGIPDSSSPTSMTQSLFLLLALAVMENLEAAVIDIGGAYLAEVSPEVKPFIDERGKLVVRLDRALYGCVQSGKRMPWTNACGPGSSAERTAPSSSM